MEVIGLHAAVKALLEDAKAHAERGAIARCFGQGRFGSHVVSPVWY